MSIESVITSSPLIVCHPLLLPPSNFPSIRVFSSELSLHIRWPKYWSFNFSISPSSECSQLTLGFTGLISLQSKGLSRGFSNPFISVQSLSQVQLFVTPWTAVNQASPSITSSRRVLKLMSIESVMPINHLILCDLLLFVSSIFSSIRVLSNESALRRRCPKYWNFSFNISPSNEHPGLISLRMDWLDLLAVQGILKNLLQHHSTKASILRLSALFIVHLLHP